MSDKEKAEELLQQSSEQKRHQTEPSTASHEEEAVSLADAVRDAYDRLDDGDAHENLTIRDKDLAALFAGLDECDSLDAVGTDAAAVLDRDDTPESKAGVLGVLVRVGLQEVAPEHIEDAKAGKRAWLSSQADEF